MGRADTALRGERVGAVHAPHLRLLTVNEIAAVLGTDRREVLSWIDTGELPCIRVGASRQPRASLAMLEAWQRSIAEQGQATTAPLRAALAQARAS